jgi:hypothetical protein
MLKFLGLMGICAVLSIFMGPLPFIVVFCAYLIMFVVKK